MLNTAINSEENAPLSTNKMFLNLKYQEIDIIYLDFFFHFLLNFFQTYNLDCLLTLIQHLLLFSYTVENLKF